MVKKYTRVFLAVSVLAIVGALLGLKTFAEAPRFDRVPAGKYQPAWILYDGMHDASMDLLQAPKMEPAFSFLLEGHGTFTGMTAKEVIVVDRPVQPELYVIRDDHTGKNSLVVVVSRDTPWAREVVQ